jgi:hypothetical protein
VEKYQKGSLLLVALNRTPPEMELAQRRAYIALTIMQGICTKKDPFAAGVFNALTDALCGPNDDN